MIVSGGTTSALTFFESFKSAEIVGLTKAQFAGRWEENLLQMIKDESPDVLPILTELKAAQEKKRWAELSKYWKEQNIIDLDAHLAWLQGGGDAAADTTTEADADTAEAGDDAEAADGEGEEADAGDADAAPEVTEEM